MANDDGERVVEGLRDTVAMASILLSQKDGDVGGVVEAIGSTVCAPDVDRGRIRA